MSADLTSILNDWPHEPGHLVVRLIEGDDRRPKVQVRLDLGLLQMNVDGRPDGLRPYGYDSLLEYFESCLDEELATDDPEGDPADDLAGPFESDDEDETAAPGERPRRRAARAEGADEDPPTDPADHEMPDLDDATLPDGRGDPPERPLLGRLVPAECRVLRDEAAQYYHRYVALMALEDFEGVVRDTSRNLRVLDLCRDHAVNAADRAVLEQFRPYILMMRARALASLAIKQGESKAAVFAIDEGLNALRQHFEDHDRPELFDEAGEAQMLRAMRDALVPKLPVSQRSELEQRMKVALSNENYELAAILRDELRMLGADPKKGAPPGPPSGSGPTSGPTGGPGPGPGRDRGPDTNA